MEIRHHPDDELLLALAAGRLTLGSRLVLRCHLERCARCRERVHMLEALGGLLIEEAEPAPMAADALECTKARIAELRRRPAEAEPVRVSAPPPLPDDACWPRALRSASPTPWRWIAPGMRRSRLLIPGAPEAKVFLLRVAAARYLPQHTHHGLELTQVIHGSFDDGRARFGPGDFCAADAEIHHQPVVQEAGECICVISLDDRLRFEKPIARLFGALVGL